MSRCCRKHATIHSPKRWGERARIVPKIIVLHSTESPPHSGHSVSEYLAQPEVMADVHVVIDTNGDLYRLVPDNQKAWHVAGYNSIALGIEQVGRAAQTEWPEAQLEATARRLACWSHAYGIPLRDARGRLGFILGSYRGGRGVVEHGSLGVTGGGHSDPGKNYPFRKVLRLARKYKRECYASAKR